MNKKLLCAVGIAFASFGSALVADAASEGDKPDHPLISRPTNAEVDYYDVKDFDSAVVVLKHIEDANAPGGSVMTVDGRVFRAEYKLRENTSLRQVQVSYQRTLSKAGFQTVLDCRPVIACGAGMQDMINQEKIIPGTHGVGELHESNEAEFVQVFHGQYKGKDTYILLVGTDQGYERAVYQQIVTVEDAASIVSVDTVASAKDLAEQLGTSGAATVAGIYFDTDKSIVKPESRPALEQVAAFLKQNPKTSIYIVGHTDGSGDYAHNQALAEARAKAVRDYLSQQLKIDASRMEPHGVGPLAPVASNRAEEGRAANRRVMIVEKSQNREIR